MTTYSQAEQHDIAAKTPGSTTSTIGRELMQHLCVRTGQKVLDFGCGTGYLVTVLCDLVGPEGEVVGVDPDQERIKVAHQKNSTSNNLFVAGSHGEIPGDGYDIVFSNMVLHRCKDKGVVIEKFSCILKKGGRLGFSSLINFDVRKHFFPVKGSASEEVIQYYENQFQGLATDKYKALVSASNFKVDMSKEFIYEQQFETTEQMVDLYMRNIQHEPYGETHFNKEVIEDYYRGKKCALSFPCVMMTCSLQ